MKQFNLIFRGLALYRFVYGPFSSLRQVMGTFVPVWRSFIFRLYAGRAFTARSKGHGIGLHNRQEIEQLTLNDLTLLSELLGDKKFILGETPCEYDATIFGHLTQVTWGLPGSIYEAAVQSKKIINLQFCEYFLQFLFILLKFLEDLKNLKEYAIRMKETFYPDWDKILEK